MWEFFDRLVSVAIPRIRDFRGLPATSWDGRGNYTFGLAEQVVFPEIDYDMLDAFGFPFKREVDVAAPEIKRRGSAFRGKGAGKPAKKK